MKFGIDIHGVITAKPDFFAKFTRLLIDNGHEVHVITGASFTAQLQQQLTDYGICWTNIFSIVDYHKEIGTKITYDNNGDPWMDQKTWNEAKGKYCDENGIDLHIDDSDTYGKHFSTPYLHLKKV